MPLSTSLSAFTLSATMAFLAACGPERHGGAQSEGG